MIGFNTSLIEENPAIRNIQQINGLQLVKNIGIIGVNQNLTQEHGYNLMIV